MNTFKRSWTYYFFVLLIVSLAVQSCDDKSDNFLKEGEIPADFNYLTVKTIDIQIDVNDQFNGQYLYKVEVFDQNPLTSDTVVNLLTAGVANQTKTFTTRVVIPQYVNTLFVRQTDPTKRSVVKAVLVTDKNSAVLDFKPAVMNSTVKQKAAPVHTDKASDYTLPATYTTLSSNSKITQNGVYYVPAGVTITNMEIQWNNNIQLFVAGKLVYNKNNGTPSIPPGFKFILLSGAEVSFSDRKEMNFEQTGILVAVHDGATLKFLESASIGNGSKLINDGVLTTAETFQVRSTSGVVVNNNEFTTKTLDLTNGAAFTNHSKLHLLENVVMNSNAVLVNNGTIEADDAFSSNNQTVKIYNNHIIKTPFFDFARGGGELFNACLIECEDFFAEGTIVHNADGALIVCQDFQSNNTTFNLTGGSLIHVKDFGYDNVDEVKESGLTFVNNVVINGIMANGVQPLFNTWKIAEKNRRNGSKVVHLKGTFEFSVSEMPAEKYFFKIDPGVTMSASPITTIPSTNCNLGGVNTGGGGGGDDDDDTGGGGGDDDDDTGGGGDDDDDDTGGTPPPADPTFPIQVIEGTDYVYSMEDLWPHMGDYDMNDFVFKIHTITKYINSSNKVEKMTFKLTPLASGSTMKLSAALQFDGVTEGKISVVSTDDMARIDEGHTQANIILFENVHALFGLSDHSIVNTFNTVPKVATSTYTFEVTFASPVDQNQVSVDKLNFYSIVGEVNSNDRHEIHLTGYNPSSKVLKSDVSYKDSNNMVWALMLPTASYNYPAENVKIFDAYPKFLDWAKSGGKEHTDWFLNPADTVGLIYSRK